MRLDKYLKVSRLIKRRTVANEVADAGRILINGKTAKASQAVKAGDILVVLEAMKMENEILAPRDGTVAQVVTTKGAVVDTGAPLVVLA